MISEETALPAEPQQRPTEWLDSNHGHIISEATALPTELQQRPPNNSLSTYASWHFQRSIYMVFLMSQSRPLFCLFLLFSCYNFNTNWKKHRWCAWDLNPGPQDGSCRRNHGAMAATQCLTFFHTLAQTLFFWFIQRHGTNCINILGCNQIGRFIGLWATFQSLWQQ